MKKNALIFGVTGQDGAFLSRLLLDKGYHVYGTSRDTDSSSMKNLRYFDLIQKVNLFSVDVKNLNSVMMAVEKAIPLEIYFLAGQSSVGLSFTQPEETINSITYGTLNVLEAVRRNNPECRMYFAGSGEMYGETPVTGADETSSVRPLSPYGIAKAAAFWLVDTYRTSYKLKCCTGILFNHESVLRSERFVTKKIIKAAVRIALGKQDTLHLGNLNISRDWGHASDYVYAMWLMMQAEEMRDYVISSSNSYKLSQFVENAFSYFDLDYKDHVQISEELLRPNDIRYSMGNSDLASSELLWRPRYGFTEIIKEMIEHELTQLK